MERARIPGIDVPATRVGLGTWAMGQGSLEDSIATLHAALDRGINLIDTAPTYGRGRAEKIVGRVVAERGRRDELILATKVGVEWDGAGFRRNGTGARVVHELEMSLKRLRTDRVDVLHLHWADPLVPIEETAEAMWQLLRAGKIRAIGAGNCSPAQMEVLREVGPLHSQLTSYNLFERGAELEALPYGLTHGMTTIVYGVLCRGLLGGAMQTDLQLEAGDRRASDPKFQRPRYLRYLGAASELDRFARERHGRRVIHLATRWALDFPGVGMVLWGAQRPEQLDALDGVMGWHLSGRDASDIARIVGAAVPDPIAPELISPPARLEEAAAVDS